MLSANSQRLSALGAIALLTTLAVPALGAGPVSVTVNGQTANLNPAPTERAGRVFVPLRGVFEQLGATVVYDNGTINATGRGHTVSLKIGSQQAIVDGQQQTVDVAPFIIGASTYVPLRFVSQALGATVNYDGTNDIVAINTSRGGGNVQPPAQQPNEVITPAPRDGDRGAITLVAVRPALDGTAPSRRPLIEAQFAGGEVDPNTIRISVDGAEVTNDATRSPRGFTYVPNSPLQPGIHRVRVAGTDRNGQPFVRGWAFTSGTSAATVGVVGDVRPRNDATVGGQFEVSGRTIPGAHVTVQVGVSSSPATVGGIVGVLLGSGGTNSASYSLTADGGGYFTTQVSIDAPAGSQLVLAIDAVDPRTGATAPPVRERLSVR
jgi:hypothetical protein